MALAIHDLGKSYGGVPVFRHVELLLEEGECIV